MWINPHRIVNNIIGKFSSPIEQVKASWQFNNVIRCQFLNLCLVHAEDQWVLFHNFCCQIWVHELFWSGLRGSYFTEHSLFVWRDILNYLGIMASERKLSHVSMESANPAIGILSKSSYIDCFISLDFLRILIEVFLTHRTFYLVFKKFRSSSVFKSRFRF